MDSFFED